MKAQLASCVEDWDKLMKVIFKKSPPHMQSGSAGAGGGSGPSGSGSGQAAWQQSKTDNKRGKRGQLPRLNGKSPKPLSNSSPNTPFSPFSGNILYAAEYKPGMRMWVEGLNKDKAGQPKAFNKCVLCESTAHFADACPKRIDMFKSKSFCYYQAKDRKA